MGRQRSSRNELTDNDANDEGNLAGNIETRRPTVTVAKRPRVLSKKTGIKGKYASAMLFFKRKCPVLFRHSSYALGIFLILCVTVIWVASSNWIQYIFGELDFNKPYFLTYFNTTGFSFWNLGYLFVPRWRRVPWDDRSRPRHLLVEDMTIVTGEIDADDELTHERSTGGSSDGHSRHRSGRRERASHGAAGSSTPSAAGSDAFEESRGSAGNDAWARRRALLGRGDTAGHTTDIRVWAANNGYDSSESSSDSSTASEVSMEEIVELESSPARPEKDHFVASDAMEAAEPQLARVERLLPYSRRTICFWAAVFCPFWFFANYLFNMSLSMTSVASNTVLSSTSSIWTLLMSYILLREKVGPLKWFAVALCVSGSIMVGLSDSGGEGGFDGDAVGGDIMALVSAFFYATYTSVLRFGLPDDDRYAMGMTFGAVGVINFLFLWPGLVVVDRVKWEIFAWPTIGQFWPLALNALIGTNLSDVLWARSVVLTSPVVATLGLALTTPLAMVVDAAFKGSRFSAVYILGALLVMCGFILVNLPFCQRWPRRLAVC